VQEAVEHRQATRIAHEEAIKAKEAAEKLRQEYEQKLVVEREAREKAEAAMKKAEENEQVLRNAQHQQTKAEAQQEYLHPFNYLEEQAPISETGTYIDGVAAWLGQQKIRPGSLQESVSSLESPKKVIVFPSRIGWEEHEKKKMMTSMVNSGYMPHFEEKPQYTFSSQYHERPVSGGCQLRGSMLWLPPGTTYASELESSLRRAAWRPIYVRANASGQTWYAGSQPIHVLMFDPLYKPQEASTTSNSQLNYRYMEEDQLIIGKEWVEIDALKHLGYRHEPRDDGRVMLDPRLTSVDIDHAVARSLMMREDRLRSRYRDPNLLTLGPSNAGSRFSEIGSDASDARSSSSSLSATAKPSRFRSLLLRNGSSR